MTLGHLEDSRLLPNPARRRARRASIGALLCLAGLASGCSTVISKGETFRSDLPNEQLGAPFSGTRMNLHGWYCLEETLKSVDYPKLVAPFAVLEAMADLPLSLVGDVLILPVDLAVQAKRPRPPLFEPPCLRMDSGKKPRKRGAPRSASLLTAP